MKHAILILLSLFFSGFLFSQEEEKAIREFSPELLKHRHELSIDHGGTLAFLYTNAELFSAAITYRRFFKNYKTAFRTGFRTTLTDRIREEGDYLSTRKIAVDAIRITRTQETNYYESNWHTLRFGIDHRFGTRRVKFLLGVDFAFGLNQYQRDQVWQSSTSIQKLDTLTTFVDFTSFNTYSSYRSEEVLNFVVGFSPIVGVNVHLSKRWILVSTMVIDYMAQIPIKSDNYFSAETGPSTNFNIVDALLFEISVGYRF
ncbi:MAG: hypothetical protein WD048_10925 [Chitinophagales bacterium]